MKNLLPFSLSLLVGVTHAYAESTPIANNTESMEVATAPAAPTATTTTTTTVITPTTTTAPSTPDLTNTKPATRLDCNYKIPAQTTSIDQDIVLKWAENATQQSFEYDFSKLDDQLALLKICYTDQGWTSFNTALQQSGNLDSIKEQKLIVSAMVSGQAQIAPLKDNQWKVTVPLQVVYQNEKEKLSQALVVDLVVGRKISGDLGIMQIIASPHPGVKLVVPPHS